MQKNKKMFFQDFLKAPFGRAWILLGFNNYIPVENMYNLIQFKMYLGHIARPYSFMKILEHNGNTESLLLKQQRPVHQNLGKFTHFFYSLTPATTKNAHKSLSSNHRNATNRYLWFASKSLFYRNLNYYHFFWNNSKLFFQTIKSEKYPINKENHKIKQKRKKRNKK